jgi:polyphosphate kinase 2 (PPK2 family)
MPRKKSRLDALDMEARLDREIYEKKLGKLQTRLIQIQQAYLFSGDSAVLVFEGWDAAGKGGCIRRMFSVLDPRGFKVWPIAAPRSYYLERHYLARFWDKLPPRGGMACFDRSWYGRVLVERVEGYAPKKRWQAAYDEINAFEQLMLDDGIRVVKCFLHITPEEQLKRLTERLENPLKRWKLSYEDFRNREKWDAYREATEEMFAKTEGAVPWTIIPGNNKKHARIAALETITRVLAKGVDLTPPSLSEEVIEAAKVHIDMEPGLIADLAGRSY